MSQEADLCVSPSTDGNIFVYLVKGDEVMGKTITAQETKNFMDRLSEAILVAEGGEE